MKIDIRLVKYEYLRLIKSFGFLFSLFLISLTTFFLMPNPDAGYCILKANDFIGNSNDIWKAITVALSANLIISTVGFFFLEGSYIKETNLSLLNVLKCTSKSSLSYLITRTVSFFLVLVSFLIAIYLSILIISFSDILNGEVRVTHFTIILMYFCLPGLLFFSVVISLIEHFIKKRVWRIASFILLTNLLFLLQHKSISPFFDFYGYFETRNIVSQLLVEKHNMSPPIYLSFGITPKTASMNTFELDNFYMSFYFFTKILALGLLAFLCISMGKKRFNKFSFSPSRLKKTVKKIKAQSDTNNYATSVEYNTIFSIPTSSNNTLMSIVLFDLRNIWAFVDKKNIMAMIVVSFLTFIFSVSIFTNYLLPLLLILMLPLFVNYIPYQNTLKVSTLFRVMPVGYNVNMLLRIIVIYLVFIVLLFPILLKLSIIDCITSLFFAFLFSSFATLFSLTSVKMFNSTKFFEVSYILFCLILFYKNYFNNIT